MVNLFVTATQFVGMIKIGGKAKEILGVRNPVNLLPLLFLKSTLTEKLEQANGEEEVKEMYSQRSLFVWNSSVHTQMISTYNIFPFLTLLTYISPLCMNFCFLETSR